jgi:outer membrane receptor for ferrienterochelin and colicin
MSWGSTGTCAITLVLATLARADEPSEIELFNLERKLDVKIASATLTEQEIETVPSVVSVITEDEIRALNLRTLRDALQLMAGVTVLDTQFGDYTVAVRGVSSPANILVTLDGVRLNDFYDGTFLVDLPLANIDRIEIIRGPGSALYGTDAFSGVVSLYSKTTDEVEAGIGAEALFDHSVGWGARAHARVTRTLRDWTLRLYGDYWDTSGPRVLAEHDNAEGTFYGLAPGETHGPRRLGVAQLSIVKHSVMSANDELEVWSAFLYRTHGPYFGPNITLARDSTLARDAWLSYLEYRLPLPSGVGFKLRLTYERRDSDNTIQDQPANYYHENNGDLVIDPGELFPEGKLRRYAYAGHRVSVQPQVSWALGAPKRIAGNTLHVGAELGYETLPQFSYAQNYANDVYQGALHNYDLLPLTQRGKDRLIVGAFAQDQLHVTRALFITAGLRFDYFSDFGTAWNPRIAVVGHPHRMVTLKALYGRAFRAPTFQELYDHTGSQFTVAGYPIAGSDELQPETTDTVEASLELAPTPWIDLRVNGFYIRTDHVIDLDPTFTVGGTTLINFPGRQIGGLESELQLFLDRDNYFLANFSWFDSEQLGDGLPGFQTNSDRRFLDKTLSDLPLFRFNAALATHPFARLRAPRIVRRLRGGLAYTFVSSSHNNERTSYEALKQFERPAFHELTVALTVPLFELIELVTSVTSSFDRAIPIALSTGSYALSAGGTNLFVGLRGHL